MKLPKHLVLGFGCLFVAASVLVATGENTKKPPRKQAPQLSALMLAKLASSQKVVGGLVSEDFEEIKRGADEILRIADAEEWEDHEDQVFAHHRTELKRQAQKLSKLADDRNLDGAAFTYFHSLTTCISCHQYCRDVLKIADDMGPMDKIVPIPVTEDAPMTEGRRTRR